MFNIVAIFADFTPNFLFEFFAKYQANVSRVHQEEITSVKVALNQAREDPVQSIMTRPGRLSCLANPFAIRLKSEFAKETPTYLVAVASR